MPYRAQRSLVKPFEPSSCAAAFDGPKTRMPAARRSSARPATSGASGPTTTRSIARSRQKSATAAMVRDVERHAFGLFGDAGIARRDEELRQQRRRRQLPGQRMLAAARADEEDVHGSRLAIRIEVGFKTEGSINRRYAPITGVRGIGDEIPLIGRSDSGKPQSQAIEHHPPRQLDRSIDARALCAVPKIPSGCRSGVQVCQCRQTESVASL